MPDWQKTTRSQKPLVNPGPIGGCLMSASCFVCCAVSKRPQLVSMAMASRTLSPSTTKLSTMVTRSTASSMLFPTTALSSSLCRLVQGIPSSLDTAMSDSSKLAASPKRYSPIRESAAFVCGSKSVVFLTLVEPFLLACAKAVLQTTAKATARSENLAKCFMFGLFGVGYT